MELKYYKKTLSDRVIECLKFFLLGLEVSEIAKEMNIATTTVKTYKAYILQEFHFKTMKKFIATYYTLILKKIIKSPFSDEPICIAEIGGNPTKKFIYELFEKAVECEVSKTS